MSRDSRPGFASIFLERIRPWAGPRSDKACVQFSLIAYSLDTASVGVAVQPKWHGDSQAIFALHLDPRRRIGDLKRSAGEIRPSAPFEGLCCPQGVRSVLILCVD